MLELAAMMEDIVWSPPVQGGMNEYPFDFHSRHIERFGQVFSFAAALQHPITMIRNEG